MPFTLVGGTALGTGRGEHLVPTLSKGTYHWALAFSRTGLATPAVFRKLDELDRTPHLDVTALSRALRTGNPHQVAPLLHNDMQAAALSLQPQLRTTLNTATHNPQHRHGRRGARRHCFRVGPHLRIPMRRRSRRPGSRGGTIAQRKHRRHIRPGARRPPQRRISG